MVESLDHPHWLFVILGLQFRGKNDNVRNVSFGQVSTERLWSFSNTSAPEDRTLNNPPELPLNLSVSCFPKSRPTDWEYPKQIMAGDCTGAKSSPAECPSRVFQSWHHPLPKIHGFNLLCEAHSLQKQIFLKKKIKPQRKFTTQSQVLEINYLPIPEIIILAGVLSLVSLR